MQVKMEVTVDALKPFSTYKVYIGAETDVATGPEFSIVANTSLAGKLVLRGHNWMLLAHKPLLP